MANRIRGITVEINGDTTGLTKALGGVNSQIKTTESQLKDVEKLLKLDPKNTELLRQKQVLLAQAVSQTSDKVKTLHEAEKQLTDNGVDENSEQFMGLRREIIEAEAALNNYKAAQSGAVAGTDKATGSMKMFNAGLDSTLAKAAAVAGGIILLGKTINEFATGASQRADDLLTESTTTGLSTRTLQELDYAAPFLDVDRDTITGAMTRNIRSMSSAQNGSGTAYEAYEKLGISVTDASGKLRNSETVFWEAIEALGAMENETERDAVAMELFGKSAQTLNPLIEAGKKRFDELAKAAHEAGYVIGEETLQELGESQDLIDERKKKSEAAKYKLGQIFAPVVDFANGSINNWLDKFNQGSNLESWRMIATPAGFGRGIGEVIGEQIFGGGETVTNVNITFTGDNAAIARALEPEITAETVRKGAGTAR